MKKLFILLLNLVVLPLSVLGQKTPKKYSHNFILKGTIFDKPKDSLLTIGCVWVIAFDRIYTVKTNAKGEYEIKFFDTTGSQQYNSFPTPDGEILFIWCEDPNKTKSVFLKKTKVKKSQKPIDYTQSPIVVTRNITIEYEFEK